MSAYDGLVRGLVADVLATGDDGIPALLIVRDYVERREIADALREEAELHGITLWRFDASEAAREKFQELESEQSDAAALLINAGEVGAWASWLEPFREQLPERVCFLVVMLFKEDMPALATLAPAFWSWVKADVRNTAADARPIERLDVAKEIKSLTGLELDEFIARWERGELPDSWNNAALTNLAVAAMSRPSR